LVEFDGGKWKPEFRRGLCHEYTKQNKIDPLGASLTQAMANQ